MVSGFGRFLRSDATTKAMTDLRAFRCQIGLDSISGIPQHLSLALGEEIFSVSVYLESWERAVEDGEEDGEEGVDEVSEDEVGGLDEAELPQTPMALVRRVPRAGVSEVAASWRGIRAGTRGVAGNLRAPRSDLHGVAADLRASRSDARGVAANPRSPRQAGAKSRGADRGGSQPRGDRRGPQARGGTARVGERHCRASEWRSAQGDNANRNSGWSVVRDRRRRRATVGAGASTEATKVMGSRSMDKKVKPKICMEITEAKGTGLGSYYPYLPVKGLREEEGPGTKIGQPKATVDQHFALGTQEWNLAVYLNPTGIRACLFYPGQSVGRTSLWACLFAPGPILGRGSLGAWMSAPGPNQGRVSRYFVRMGRGSKQALAATSQEPTNSGVGGVGHENDFFVEDGAEACDVEACNITWIGDVACRSPVTRTMSLLEHTLAVGGEHLGQNEGPNEQCRESVRGATKNAPPTCSELRSSKRLAKDGSSSILLRAMARKITQREGGEGSGVDHNIKRIIRKGRLCGVELADDEAKHFVGFSSKRD